uniref:DUOXA-like protein C06E1.3 n=1 Tax=Meloidogyne javanica TaxID=6303 RepID=A0A915N751_MELJA
MSIAWFDAFRENGAPTWYGDNTPTPVLFDLGLAILVWLFATPTIAFILILPGIRRLRALSTFCFLFSMSIGASIGDPQEQLFPLNTTETRQINRELKLPQIAESDISKLLFGNSLNNTNLTLFQTQQIEEEFYSQNSKLIYNERFEFDDVSGMEVGEVLQKGLPFPILRVMEYLSVDRTGFLWGKQYRLAGYYTMAALWLAFALWLLQLIFLCAVPSKFGQISLFCGLTSLFADCVYAWANK